MALRWTPDDDARLRAWYRAYVPLAEIGSRLGRSGGAVHARRIALGLPARRRPWPWPSRLDAQLIAAAQAREPVAAVARRLGLSPDAVSRHRRHVGLGEPPRRRWTPEEDALVRDAVDDPETLAALAKRLGRAEGAVAARARQLAPSDGRPQPPRWTTEEDDLLRQGYAACMTCRAIGRQLLPRRSSRAVSARALRLGLTTYGRRWTPGEDAALRAMAVRGAEAAQIARALTRTTSAVRRRATRLGVALQTSGRRSKPWTAEEDAVLRQWRTFEPGRLAQLLGRSDGSVRSRLRALDLLPDGSPHYQPPATARLTPAQRRLLVRYSEPLTSRRILALAERFDREPAEVLQLVAKQRRAHAA
jgi:hypothetical protein